MIFLSELRIGTHPPYLISKKEELLSSYKQKSKTVKLLTGFSYISKKYFNENKFVEL